MFKFIRSVVARVPLLNRIPGSVVDRFVRVVGGQAVAAAILAAITFIGADPGVPAAVTPLLGAALTALDKFCRDRGVY